jgi:hypothetical protein
MQSYYELLAPAVARLEANTGDARRALYDRARTALVAQMRAVDPPLGNSDIIRERLALEDAICNVEVDCKALANFDRIQLKPPKRPGVVMRILRALALTQPAAPAARRSGRPDIVRRQSREWPTAAPKRLYEPPRLMAGISDSRALASYPQSAPRSFC